MKKTLIGIFIILFGFLNITGLVAQTLIADYPLTTNSLDRSGHFGPITYGARGTPPPGSACGLDKPPTAYFGVAEAFITPDLRSLFNPFDFEIDLDFIAKGKGMPVLMSNNAIFGIYISSTGLLGIKYGTNNFLYSNSYITAGVSYHVELHWYVATTLNRKSSFSLLLNSVTVLSPGVPSFNAQPSLGFTNDSSPIQFSGTDLSTAIPLDVAFRGATPFIGCINNLKIFSSCTVGCKAAPTNASCNLSNGSITATGSGGSGSYQYSKDNGVTFQNSNIFTNLAAGDYKIIVKDKGGILCSSDFALITVAQNGPAINFTYDTTAATCGQGGSITVKASGGSGTYEYSKDSGATFQSTNIFTGLGGGVYQVITKDKNGAGCSSNARAVTITTSGSVPTFNTTSTSASCGQTNGSITVTASGGGGAYEYSKDNGTTFQSSNVFSNLAAGTYQMIVRNPALPACAAIVQPKVITQSGSIPTFTTDPKAATCGQANGSVTVTASGGSGSYEYSKDNGATFQPLNVFANLAAGNYQIVVRNTAPSLCAAVMQLVPITASGSAPTFIANSKPAICNEPNGSITVTASGGSGAYEYSKDNGTTFQGTNVFADLAAGTYQILVRDKSPANCTSDTQAVPVTQSSTSIDNTLTNSALTVCQGTGVKIDAVSNAQYKYQWFKDDVAIAGTTTQSFTATVSGQYKVLINNTVTGCSAYTKAVAVHIIGKPVAAFNDAASYCTGTPVDFINSSKPPDNSTTISSSWDFGDGTVSASASHTYKTAGTYTVSLTATIATPGCNTADIVRKTIKITAVAPGVTYSDVIVPSGRPYELSARANVGYKYLWSPAGSLSDPNSRTPLVTTTGDQLYKITITSASGCTTTDEQRVLVAKPQTSTTSNGDSIVVVPTAFTPNGNGINDRLKPIPYNIDKLSYFKVYNRWGQLVYDTKVLGEGWDGTLKGKAQPFETYTWILECSTLSGKKIKQSGRSVLIR